MSVEGMVIAKALEGKNNTNTILLNDIKNLLIKQIARQGSPRKILVSPPGITLNVNVANETNLLQGPPIPQGFAFEIQDFTVSFRTAGGTVKLVATDAQGDVRDDILTDISTSGSGAGGVVLDPGEALAILVQTQGAGTITVRCSGVIKAL